MDKKFHSDLISLGCAACRLEGRQTIHPLQIHHPRGRNKGKHGDVSERYAICLCAEHHDQRIYSGFWSGADFIGVDRSIPSVHHAKKSFYIRYGSEQWLVHESYRELGVCPPWFEAPVWEEYLQESCRKDQEQFLDHQISGMKTLKVVCEA